MKQTIIIKSLLIAGATLLGLAATSRAQDAALPPAGKLGLLGQTYAGLDYSYIDFHNSPTNADAFGFQFNQALNSGLDGLLSYNWSQTGLVLGERARQQELGAGLRAFSTGYSWGKPYVEAGAGWTWFKYAGAHDNSFTWHGAVGVEFQVASKVTVTPYVKYEDAPGLDVDDKDTWNFGVKANYWVNTQWGVTGGINYDDEHDTTYTVGTNFRF